jgi:hypothetical protein
MPSVAPPYTTLTAAAAALTAEVPDTRGGFTDSDFIVRALRQISDAYPGWGTVDVGDGATREWILGAGGSFTAWVFGYSEVGNVTLERLSAVATPDNPPRFLTKRRDWWFDRRTTAGAPRLYLVVAEAPGTSLLRVRFPIRWVATASADSMTLPDHLHDALVALGCAFKCGALGSYYRSTVDTTGGGDVFDGEEVSASYFRAASHWRKEYARLIGKTQRAHLTHGTANPNRRRVFGKRIP